ncbi:hypothetical protein [Agaribacter marinus]|uniref:Uncharacterized protein n=1 Tax=Agaribacter marinus TaxID=1431249 RepID=A0AA37WHB9_9ALTE|nr:hypothetical protein [Agaribacter marinus]GLR69737.1 hypothetical protein GCM10007852_06450 [Agaribacter marinus]
MNDTGSNAMTEVALGLSMAFFSILILALMSMGVNESEALNSRDIDDFAHISMQAKVNNPREGLADTLASELDAENTQVLYFYLDGHFFDSDGDKVNESRFTENEDLVIAVAEDLPIQDALKIQSQLSGKSLKMTTMSNDWLHYLLGQI